MIDFIRADVLDWAARYDGPKFHALLCDPPYHLTDVVASRYGRQSGVDPENRGQTSPPFGNNNRGGFMNKEWDGGDIAFRPETWAALGEHLLPGAFCMAFSGCRTYHRMACAIEDAGFILHSMLIWCFGSGFPKATRIDTQIDKAAGAEREVTEVRGGGYGRGSTFSREYQAAMGYRPEGGAFGEYGGTGKVPITAPATPLAATWAGHRYGLQALKPALEPIAVFALPKGLAYNQLQDELRTTGLLLEELWTTYASDVETLSRAAREVNTVLSNALGLTDQSLRGNGSLAMDAGGSSTKPLDSCGSTAASGDGSVPESATLQPKNGEGRASASNAVKSSESETGHDGHGIAAVNALMPPENAPCWKTPCEMGIDTDTLTGILRSNLARAKFDLSTIWLWRLTWDELCNRANRYTTETAKKTTTELRILSYLLHRITQSSQDTGSTKSSSVEALLYANDANNLFTGLLTFPLEPSPTVRPASLDPICVFQKPYAGRPVDSITRTGAGALWVEGGRIGTDGTLRNSNAGTNGDGWRMGTNEHVNGSTAGRWPSNLLLQHAPGCRRVGVKRVRGTGTAYGQNASAGHVYGNGNGLISQDKGDEQRTYADPDGYETVDEWQCVEGCAAAALGRMSGESGGGKFTISAGTKRDPGWAETKGMHTPGRVNVGIRNHGDEGTCARFFQQCDWALEEAEPMFYAAKASRRERDSGLPNGQRCTHPTVKALSLTKYLATLLLPPAEYAPRRLLCPFSGVGSECIGAALAGWDEVTGIEAEAEYVEMARARAGYWLMQPALLEAVNA